MVREHEDLVFISQNGMVQRTGVRGINQYGRSAQGVRVMNLREGDEVSAVALVMESQADEATGGDEALEGAADDGVVAVETEPADALPDEPVDDE